MGPQLFTAACSGRDAPMVAGARSVGNCVRRRHSLLDPGLPGCLLYQGRPWGNLDETLPASGARPSTGRSVLGASAFQKGREHEPAATLSMEHVHPECFLLQQLQPNSDSSLVLSR